MMVDYHTLSQSVSLITVVCEVCYLYYNGSVQPPYLICAYLSGEQIFSISIRKIDQKYLISHKTDNITFIVLLWDYVNPLALCFNIV